jgi:hypothetical protein
MSTHRKLLILGGIILAVLVFPLLGGLILYDGSFPDGFFQYPILQGHPKPGFSWVVFGLIGFVCLLIIFLYVFPQLFGFKSSNSPSDNIKTSHASFPVWFWIGFAILVFVLIIIWGRLSKPEIITDFGSTLFYWSLFVVLDGILYKRLSGISLIADKINLVISLAISSAFGWLIYAYLNFFLDENWFYPYGDLITSSEFVIYLILASSALGPLIVVTYLILKSFPSFYFRYSNGPVIRFSKKIKIVLLVLSLILCFAFGAFPHELFFFVWLGPLLSLGIIMDLLGVWSPFKEIGKSGNWSPVMIIFLAGLIQGFSWEAYNYLSADHQEYKISHTEKYNEQPHQIAIYKNGKEKIFQTDSVVFHVKTTDVKPVYTHRPDYWVYNVPYVNRFHIFEMPVLGLFGYLPYGGYVWVWWIIFAVFTGVSSRFNL